MTQPPADRRPALPRRSSVAVLAVLLAATALPAAAQTTAQTAAPATAAPAAAAPAAPATIPVPPEVAATVAKLTQGKATILKAFQAPQGLIGLAVSAGPGKNLILYATPDGAYIVQGVIVSAAGDNLTQQSAADFLPQPPSAADNLAALDKAHTFLWGDAKAAKELWIVFDPNCIYCHKTFEALQKPVADGQVKVHILQVGFLKPSSLGRAAAILGAKDPVAALTEDETKFDTGNEEGGIPPDLTNADAVAEVKANNDWMEAQQISGTPYLLYHDTKGNAQGIAGYVDDIKGLLGDIGTGS